MAQWYYSEGPNRNIGPLTTQEMADRFRRGFLLLDTLIWRDGMAQWQPLRNLTSELGLATALDPASTVPQPPPLPGPPPVFVSAAPRYAAAPEPRGLSRGMIILIVCVAAIIPAIAILGILAAIALPAYQDYTVKARVAEVIVTGNSLRAPVQEYVGEYGRCPRNGEGVLKSPGDYATRYVEAITVGELDDGTCAVALGVRGVQRADIDQHTVWLSLDPQTHRWSCSSDIADRYLPSTCRE